jgi:hypothetical protein
MVFPLWIIMVHSHLVSNDTAGFVQWSLQLLLRTGASNILHQWHLFTHFWTCQSTWTHFTVAKHCRHIVLRACNEFLPLTPPSAHQNLITAHCSSLVHEVNGVAMLMTLVVQDNWMVNMKYITATTGRFHACDCMYSAVQPSATKI